MSWKLIHCSARVTQEGSILLDADEIPAKMRLRHWFHNWAIGTKLKATVWYQQDHYHGRTHHDVYVRDLKI